MKGEWIRKPAEGTTVVFVHGILSSGESCWRHSNGAYWPDLLKDESELQSLGIYVYTYETGFSSGSYSLSDVVDDLKERLLTVNHVADSKKIIFVCYLSRLQPARFLSPGPLWWALNWESAKRQFDDCINPADPSPDCPDDWEPGRGSVLLIDEIDKADTDLPNSLLETLGNGDFKLPYVGGSVRREADVPAPLVVITTNEERELPAAFVRRCLVLPLALPDKKDELIAFLCRRGEVHFGKKCGAEARLRAAELLLEDRQVADPGQPRPGQAEYLDLLRAVAGMAQTEAEQLQLLDTLRRFVYRKAATGVR